MSLFGQLNATAFDAFGQPIKWSDMTGNLLGLAALALGWRRSLWTWPVQLVSGLVLISAFASAPLAGGVGKQLLVITVAPWGLRQWRHGGRGTGDGQIAVRFATWPERAVLAAGAAGGTLAVGGVFVLWPQLSWNPWPDAYIFVGTLVAMVAQARGLVEFWLAWLLVDIVGVPLAFSSGLAFSGLVYLLYFVLVLWGLRAWWVQTLTSPAAPSPALEGAA